MLNRFLPIFNKIHTKDIRLTEDWLSRTPFYAGFWCRIRIDNAIERHASNAKGDLLDVGCGLKPFEKFFLPHVKSYTGIEYSDDSGYRGNKADFCGDASALPIADCSFDTILCTEVMEHVPDPEKTIAEFARVLRPGGVLITTAPFIFPIHDEYDFFRYTPKGLAVMMKRYGLVVNNIEPLSGDAVTLALNVNLYIYSLFTWKKWLYPIGLILRPILLLLTFFINVLGRLFEIIMPSKSLPFNNLTIASKPE